MHRRVLMIVMSKYSLYSPIDRDNGRLSMYRYVSTVYLTFIHDDFRFEKVMRFSCNMAMDKHCKQTITLLDLTHLRELSDENYREMLQLAIPNDNRIIISFYYMSWEFSKKSVSVDYMLKIEVKPMAFSRISF